MTTKPQILVVEDEPEISRFLVTALTANGYTVKAVDKGAMALKLSAAQPPDVVILDLGLPDMDGKDIIRSLRDWSRMPIIVLSARNQEDEKVQALDLGADDYLTKPFGTSELLARINVALRHSRRREAVEEDVYVSDELRLDIVKRKVFLKDAEIHLTPKEYNLLVLLALKAGQVVTQTEMLKEVWGKNSGDNDHYLRIYIQRLRQKIGDDPLHPKYIFTEPGVGYRLKEADQ